MGKIAIMGRIKERCPNCGFNLSLSHQKKITLRILVDKELADIWDDFSMRFETNRLAFRELLRLAGLIGEKARAYVEAPTKT